MMAKLHVIYDPSDKLETSKLPSEIKVAVMPLADDLNHEEISEVVHQVINLLLQQVRD